MLILDYGRQIYAVIDLYPRLFYETATVVCRMSRVFKLYDTKGEMSYDSARFCSKVQNIKKDGDPSLRSGRIESGKIGATKIDDKWDIADDVDIDIHYDVDLGDNNSDNNTYE
jgi:hypothetical protein